MSSVSLAFTLQLLPKSGKEPIKVLKDSRIIDIDFPICVLDDPSLDIAPGKDSFTWQGPFGNNGPCQSMHSWIESISFPSVGHQLRQKNEVAEPRVFLPRLMPHTRKGRVSKINLK